MKTTQIILAVLITFFQQLLPTYGNDTDISECWVKRAAEYNRDSIDEGYSKLKQQVEFLPTWEQKIIDTHVEKLYEATLLTRVSRANTILKEFYDIIENKIYDQELADRIIPETIKKLAQHYNIYALPNVIWRSYGQGQNQERFETAVRFLLSFYRSVRGMPNITITQIYRGLGYILYQVINDERYDYLDPSLILAVDNIFKEFPPNERNLYSARFICIQNARYSSFLYPSKKADKLLLSDDPRGWNAGSQLSVEFEERDTSYVEPELHFWSYVDGSYLTLIKGKKNWVVSFLADRALLKQNEFLMCATVFFHDGKRVVKESTRYTGNDLSCQWSFIRCVW